MKTVREQMVADFTKEVAAGLDKVIESGLPEGYDIEKITRTQHPDKVEIWSYEGVPFLELHPMVMSHEGTAVTATNLYRYLNRG